MWDDDLDTPDNGHAAELASVPVTTVGMAEASADDPGGMIATMLHAAQHLARDPKTLIARAKQIGGLLGERGFYRFPVGGKAVEGPSIDMAEALAQEWGGVLYRVHIVHSAPLPSGGMRLHLRAQVADMKTLVCAEVDQVIATTAPPGKFANKPEQSERWHGMQMQSAASKIVRNAILRVLPEWFVDPAFQAAKAAAAGQALNGKTLGQARQGALDALGSMGCGQAELERFLGQPFDMWAVPQIAALKSLYRDLRDGATSIEAWRASLAEDDKPAPSSVPSRSALGLPAKTDAAPVTDQMPKAESEPEPVKAKGKTKGTKTEQAE